MKWVSTLSEVPGVDAALAEILGAASEGLAGERPDLAVVFVSPHHASFYPKVASALGQAFPTALVVGCSAQSVIGGGQEREEGPAISLTVARLPGVEVKPFHLEAEDLPDPDPEHGHWERALGIARDRDPQLVLLSDPFSFDVEGFVRGLDRELPASVKVGGVASGGEAPGDNALFLGDRLHRSGLVGVALSGNLVVDAVVAQGCRPIGQPMFATRCRENWLLELDGEPALEVLQRLYRSLSVKDQELCRGSLFLGLEMRGDQSEYRQGDFLIRNLVGSDPKIGAIAVGGLLREPQVVQFHLRDAQTSADDLDRRLELYCNEGRSSAARGALLFSCLGRGSHLYGHAGHDSEALRRWLGDVALGGFFCNGEIGPVGGTTFLHGYTSAFGIFREREERGG